ncbi:sodium/nucleoside cotransporter 1 [Latimeria chalumnae]|uniref:sodium/nucleoside cotransporter 1 n=1 Tax=Latimeria chalumnae TaxID=7897 RepID=UPI00313C69FA
MSQRWNPLSWKAINLIMQNSSFKPKAKGYLVLHTALFSFEILIAYAIIIPILDGYGNPNLELEEVNSSDDADKNGIENDGFDIKEESLCNGIRNESPLPQEKKARKMPASFSTIAQPFSVLNVFCKTHSEAIKLIVLGLIGEAYIGYFIAACVLNFQRALALFVINCVVVFFVVYELIKRFWGKAIIKWFSPVGACFKGHWKWMKWFFWLAILAGLVAWLVLDTSRRSEQLVSFAGVCMFVVILFICSKTHRAVSWRAVFWGLGLQFVLGIFIIRTDPGFQAFKWLGGQVQIFLDYTKAGSGFMFGNKLINEAFAFQALPIVIFFSCVMSILYYLGVMQVLILKIAWLMQVTMGTTATESLSVAGNIFVGQTEAPLLIRPYLGDMTNSEMHTVMTGGLATIAGSVLGAYISFGIDASSLIAASVMAAPCALGLSKLVYPETELSKFKDMDKVDMESGEEQNVLEAASNGASAAVGLVANIAANLIAFIAVLEFINAALSWFGGMVDYPELSFQIICSYIFKPIAFMMGVSWDEAFLVAELLGTKIFLNEFVAFERLSVYKKNRIDGSDEWINGKKQWLSIRAETISTYALCGFANFSSVGIILGGLSSMAPHRKRDLANTVLRALLTGACVSMINACIAGILYVPRGEVDCISFLNGSIFNVTSYNIKTCCNELFGRYIEEKYHKRNKFLNSPITLLVGQLAC